MRTVSTCIFLCAAAVAFVAQGDIPLYKDPAAPVEARVEDLLSRMTLREKVVQLQDNSTNRTEDFNRYYTDEGVGAYHDMALSARDAAIVIDSLQRYMRDKTRLGIPALTTAEGVQGVIQNGCTVFPVSLANGATFNPGLVYEMAAMAAEEAKAIGIYQFLSPVLDLARELRWGRVEECYGEDPFLVGEMATAFVRGAQDHGVGAMPKHFVAHGTPAGGLNTASVAGGENDLRNIYGYPFMKTIEKGNPFSIMSCYSTYDGVPVTGSYRMLTEYLRDELGFDGFVYSDWGAIEQMHSKHHVAVSEAEAAKMALQAGLDMDVADWTFHNLEKLVEAGEISEEDIDRACRRVLKVKFKLGLFDGTGADVERVDKIVRSPKHVALARRMAQESVIMLENHGILPLDSDKLKKIALIGPNSAYGPPGDYGWVAPDWKEIRSLYDGMREVLPESVTVTQADGCDWWSQDTTGIAQAAKLASEADVAVVAVGTRSFYLGRNAPAGTPTTGEGFDLSALDLPGKQLELMKAVKATGTPMVVVLITGKPLVMNWAGENADALLVQFYGGEQQGMALADIIVGNVNPSGRLNVSFPRSTGNTPCFYNHPLSDRLRWNEQTGEPAEIGGQAVTESPGSPEKPGGRYVFDTPYARWAFGHGLSYSDFEYSEPRLNTDFLTEPTDTLTVTLDVKNTGRRDGKEVVQVYVRDMVSSIATPLQQLKAFEKIEIPAGEVRTVSLRIPASELALYTTSHGWEIEPGDFEIQIGPASDNILYRKRITYRKSDKERFPL